MTAGYSVNIPDLEAMAGVLSSASLDLADLPGGLASRANGPESASVIGSGSAAAKYTQAVDAWRRNLTEVVSSLDNLSKMVSLAAALYAQTESDNTAKPAP